MLLAALGVLSTVQLLEVMPAAAAVDAPRCSSAGTWTPGELNVYWLDVEQGDSQLIVGPTGRTLLVDLGETSFAATGTTTKADAVAAKVRAVCGIAAGPVHLDAVLVSHHHLDHIGYAANPNDTTAYGNGLYRLLNPDLLAFTVGTLYDRDGGTWVDSNGDGDCDVGTAAAPSPEAAPTNAGTTSQTARRWICWLYGPAAQRDRAHIQSRVVRLRNDVAFPALDLGPGVTAKVVQANAKGVLQADGMTPVSGDRTKQASPPSENDYSAALRVQLGDYVYATAGDSDGEYSSSASGYTYNDVEKSLVGAFGNVATARVNHHGSSHSTSSAYVGGLDPETAVVSCGANSYGHPANRVLAALRAGAADTYLTNSPCDDVDSTGTIDYTGTFNKNGDVRLTTSGGGAGYTVRYDTGSRTYATTPTATPGATASNADLRLNEYLMAPQATGAPEWVELYNPTDTTLDAGGLYLDDVAGGGGAPKLLTAGTTVPARGRRVVEFASGFLNNTGTESVRLLRADQSTVVDTHDYALSSTQYDKVLRRTGDGGAWCAAISPSVTKGSANPGTCP